MEARCFSEWLLGVLDNGFNESRSTASGMILGLAAFRMCPYNGTGKGICEQDGGAQWQ